MKKIAYVELDTHAEIARNFLDLMQHSEEFRADFYFSRKILKELGKSGQNIFVTAPDTVFAALQKENYDLVIIGTAHRFFNVFLKIAREFNTAVIAHNLNFTQVSRFQLFKNVFVEDFKYRLKLLLKEGLLSAPEIFRKAGNLLVLEETLVQQHPNLKLRFLPVFYNKFNESTEAETPIVVIPGAVSQERRDYRSVLEKIKKVKTNLQIVFLGKASGKELVWLQDFEKLNLKNIQPVYFTEKIPQDIFDGWMRSAFFLWCPIQKETRFFSQKEMYGRTKMSGNIGDAIKYGKVAVFPDAHQKYYPFVIGEKRDFEAQIPTLKDFAEYDFAEHFGKNKVLKKLEETLQQLLKI